MSPSLLSYPARVRATQLCVMLRFTSCICRLPAAPPESPNPLLLDVAVHSLPCSFHPLDAVSPFSSNYTGVIYKGESLIDGGLAAAVPRFKNKHSNLQPANSEIQIERHVAISPL